MSELNKANFKTNPSRSYNLNCQLKLIIKNSDLIVYNGPVIFKPNEKIASLFTHIKQDNIIEPDEEFSYSFKNVATRSKRAPNQQGNGKVTIGNSDPNTDSSEYDLILHF